MDCKGSTDLVTRIVSGNASPQEEAELRAHAAACPACAELECRLSRTWALMGQLQPVVSKSPVPAAPRRTVLRSPLWVVSAAAAAVLVVSALAFSLFKPESRTPSTAPVAAQGTPDELRRDLRDEENRVQNVLTRIDLETPVIVAPPAPEAVDLKAPATAEKSQPKPEASAAPERREAVAKAPAETRVEDRKAAPPAAPAPVEAPLPVIATLDRLEGDVFAVSAGKRVPALSGHKLVSGDALETSGKTSQAVVEFADGTRLVLGADTIVDSIRIADGKRVTLKQGVLAAQISKQPAGEPMLFSTATAEARVLGTRLTLSVTPSSTRLEVREGRVRVTRREDNASVEVTADHFVQCGKGLSMAPKPVTTVRVALHETFDRPRWGGGWIQGGEANLGVRMTSENGSLSIKTLQKPAQDLSGSTKLPSDAAEAARRAVQGVGNVAGLSKKDWPRAGWLENRQAYGFSNDAPIRIRTRIWNSHNDPDRITWVALNRGVSGQGLSLERRGPLVQLWVEGAVAPVWKAEFAAVQEWETLELWVSKDQMIVRRNEETLFTGANPLKVKAGTLSIGVNAKMELAQDEEVRFDDIDVLLTTRAEFSEVSR
ncbi:MAG: FecR domain-containing protein [Planctomycetes bacterium]|nr:FecR domain-containing protein [Planctomycetota bacterium]